jgi:large subunit ribosomal protein L22
MEIKASTQSVRISPRKVNLVAGTVRGKSIDDAQAILKLVHKRGASVIEKTLMSAVANAVNNKQLTKDSLKVKSIDVTGGPALKRYHASTRGRIHPYKKRSSHITVTLIGGDN